MTITIRNLVEAHLESAKVILDAAYGGSRSRISSLRRYLALQPDGVFLALLDDLPAGIGGVIDYGTFATVGMVGVLPEMQRRGIGRAIMQHILGWIGEQGCREVTLDATNAGAALYTSLGFDTTGYTCQFQQAERTTVPSVESRIVPASMTDVAAIAAMDRPVFGAQREHVLAALIAGYPARAFISYNKAGDVTGYVIAQEQTLGPWVAHTSEDAEALLLAALALPYDTTPTVILPASNTNGIEMLKRYGFQLQRSLQFMQRESRIPPGKPELLYGKASYALG